MPATQRKCIYEGLTMDVDRHYIWSVTATTHQEKGILTLESNPSDEWQVLEILVSTLGHMQVRNGAGKGIKHDPLSITIVENKPKSKFHINYMSCYMDFRRKLIVFSLEKLFLSIKFSGQILGIGRMQNSTAESVLASPKSKYSLNWHPSSFEDNTDTIGRQNV